MLYQVTMWNGPSDEDRAEDWTERLAEAPAHRSGLLPAALVVWAAELAHGSMRQWFTIRAYQPVRVGYAEGRNCGSSSSEMLDRPVRTRWATDHLRGYHAAYWAETRTANEEEAARR